MMPPYEVPSPWGEGMGQDAFQNFSIILKMSIFFLFPFFFNYVKQVVGIWEGISD